jgi:DNA-binding IscR family transcriptional regulator
MSKVSKEKRDKISENIISILYLNFPKSIFTSKIAEEITRDEEFTKKILNELKKKRLIISIHKNSEGLKYSRRIRWRISNEAYEMIQRKNKKL